MDRIDCVVVGAGVVGLAVARALVAEGLECLIVEKEQTFGSETSSRNSEVIHAGIYYSPTSLKARLCVLGREKLYAYCQSRHIDHRRCGKLIVAANPAQVEQLAGIQRAAALNGVGDLQWLDGAAAMQLEPELRCTAALLSPSTGIVDSHGLMRSLLGEAEAGGAVIAYGARVTGLTPMPDGMALTFGDDSAPALKARVVVNAAGLHAPALAASVLPSAHRVRSYYAKGSYFTLIGRTPFSRLIYPAPEPGGLGVHITLDLAGRARFGPDVEWVEHLDYAVDPGRADGFYAAVRSYWPGLEDGRLAPAYCGIRPKITPPGASAADFMITGPADHGVRGLINLFGIESPGLTAALAIAEHVSAMARDA